MNKSERIDKQIVVLQRKKSKIYEKKINKKRKKFLKSLKGSSTTFSCLHTYTLTLDESSFDKFPDLVKKLDSYDSVILMGDTSELSQSVCLYKVYLDDKYCYQVLSDNAELFCKFIRKINPKILFQYPSVANEVLEVQDFIHSGRYEK